MIHTANSVRTLQAVAMSVGLAILLWSTGLPSMMLKASAASITNASDTLSNSAPSLTSDHTIAFTAPNGMTTGQTFTITFPGTFNMGAVGENDIDILVNGTASNTAPTTAAPNTWGVTVSGQAITFETPTNSGVASNTPIVVLIGDNATGGSGNDQITNPAAVNSYAITIAGTMQDAGELRVAIVDQVTASANVDTSLTFGVAGVAGAQGVNGTSTTDASTATTIPFGTLSIGGIKTLAHDLTVATNAANGYTVTVQQTGALQSSTGATIDGFSNGSNATTPIAWQAPSAQISDPNTYGHWGLTSNDYASTSRAVEFSNNAWVSGSTTPIAIMGATTPADGTTAGIGTARVGYQIQISALQEAGDDYTTTLRYVVTPTF